jgi:FtsH-binding integral membrane protein
MNFTKYNVSAESSVQYDMGLRAYMLRIFNLMTMALAITGLVAAYASTSQAFLSIMYSQTSTGMGLSAIGWVIQLAPLFMVFFLSVKIQSMSVQAAQMTFWVYAVLMGLSLSSIFLAYTGESIAKTFFITASVFGAMSIYGYSTKKDLTSFGSFLMMGVIGLVLASVVNIFLQSSALGFAVSVVGVIAFTGLTAYDVQKLKNIYVYSARMDKDAAAKLAVHGALTLYLDFINLFIMLLRLMGSRRD